jgi:excisionase family DNA binding protein
MPKSQSMPPLLTVAEVARYLRVHPTTIYRLLRQKRIPAFRVANDWRFNTEEIDRWIKVQQRGN